MTQSNNKGYMLLFTIGPVQPFIEQARKTRDLWTGSFLLSSLMQAAMRELEGEMIFPKKRTIGNVSDLPNKYICLFDNEGQASESARRSRENIKATWEGIRARVWDAVIGQSGVADESTRAIWERQTDFERLFEVYWVVTQKDELEYPKWLFKTEELLAARKRLRAFLPQEEPGLKSTMSGEREALCSASLNAKQWWREAARGADLKPHELGQHEWLDAVDTVKRFALPKDALELKRLENDFIFPSTSSIAVASFVERLFEEKKKKLDLSDWEKKTRRLRVNAYGRSRGSGNERAGGYEDARNEPIIISKDLIDVALEGEDQPSLLSIKASQERDLAWLLQRDGDLYFPAVFARTHLTEDYGISDSEMHTVIRDGLEAQRALFKQTDAANIARPTPYYALIRMDGDRMGFLLSGVAGKEEHSAISDALSTFSRDQVPQMVERHYPGRLVYAGGDDVLAFAPLIRDVPAETQPSDALQLANELQRLYCAQVRQAVAGGGDAKCLQKRQEGVTASTGIVVAHHYTALSYVMRESREAEKLAKNRYGRNALVLTVLRRSGEQTRVGCHWAYEGLEAEGQPIALFSRFLAMLKQDVLSPKCVELLLDEASALVDLDENAQASEVRRILKRQLNTSKKSMPARPGSSETYESEVKRIAGYITSLAQVMERDMIQVVIREKRKQNKEISEEVARERLALDLHIDGRRRGLVEVLGWLKAMAFLARKEQE